MAEKPKSWRRQTIESALEDYASSGQKRTEMIEYRGIRRDLEVVTLPIDLPLLNHDNSRLSAQLVDHPQRKAVESDPTSTSSQEILSDLLMRTEKFEELREQLKELGQQKAGLISRDGMLINGNTRLVALRKLGLSGIDVAVLPSDALPEDFLDIEMSLQLTTLTHQDYTFTNQLLLMRRYLDAGGTHTEETLARKLGWMRRAKVRINQHMRMLYMIEEIRALHSEPFPYEYFDTRFQMLKDLDEKYQELLSTDFEAAESLKWSRITAMFLGINKDQVRAVDEDFFEDRVLPRLEKSGNKFDLFYQSTKDTSDGLDELLGGRTPRESQSPDLKKFATALVNTLDITTGEVQPEIANQFQEVKVATFLAAEDKITTQKRKSILAGPTKALQEMRLDLDRIEQDFSEVVIQKDFKLGDFHYELRKVEKAVEALVKSVARLEQQANGRV